MKKFAIITILLTVATTLSAQQRSAEVALECAKNFIQKTSKKKAKAINPQSTLQLKHTEVTDEGVAYYVFDQGANNGFVIVGGDEVCRTILGYTDHGSYDTERLPENVKWWLSQYASQFRNVKKAGFSAKMKAPAKRSTRETIPDLVTAKWDQSEPYYNMTPKSWRAHTVTGCVATAMAQVMYYHKWPKQGTGQHSYSAGNFSPSADFGATTYDWDNMIDDYSKGYTKEQADAVATLMFHAGVSVDMEYSITSSGAVSTYISGALSTYFGYDKSAFEAFRRFYTDDEWEDLVYNELANNRPVLYGGSDYHPAGGGHQFVCHGYDAETDLYAFNWGWSGDCDGYYAITGANGSGVLQPNGSGIGGAGNEAAYTAEQSIIVNMMPDQGGDYHYVIWAYSGYTVGTGRWGFKTKEIGATNPKITMSLTPVNISSIPVDMTIGIILRDMETDEEILTDVASDLNGMGIMDYKQLNLQFTPEKIVYNGEYEIIPVYRIKDSEEWHWLDIEASFEKPRLIVEERESRDNPTRIGSTMQNGRNTLYDIMGRRTKSINSGVTLLRMADGSVRKIL